MTSIPILAILFMTLIGLIKSNSDDQGDTTVNATVAVDGTTITITQDNGEILPDCFKYMFGNEECFILPDDSGCTVENPMSAGPKKLLKCLDLGDAEYECFENYGDFKAIHPLDIDDSDLVPAVDRNTETKIELKGLGFPLTEDPNSDDNVTITQNGDDVPLSDIIGNGTDLEFTIQPFDDDTLVIVIIVNGEEFTFNVGVQDIPKVHFNLLDPVEIEVNTLTNMTITASDNFLGTSFTSNTFTVEVHSDSGFLGYLF